jgi:hypothetical protein
MQIDQNTLTWHIILKWATESRLEMVESLIGSKEDHAADKLRGQIRQIDALLDLPDQEFDDE